MVSVRGQSEEATAAFSQLMTMWQPSDSTFPYFWWQSANALEAVIDYYTATNQNDTANIISDTYQVFQQQQYLGEYMDDAGWWGISWLKAYEFSGRSQPEYLQASIEIFNYIRDFGYDNTSYTGGIWWQKPDPSIDQPQKGAIENELFMVLAVRLYAVTSDPSYLAWADQIFTWMQYFGLVSPDYLVINSLNININAPIITAVLVTDLWTYNQGVILGGLIGLAQAHNDQNYLQQAQLIADAAMQTMIYSDGILKEICEPSCGNDGGMFKGIFMRYLGQLNDVINNSQISDFISLNAKSIWANDKDGTSNQFGLVWNGPYQAEGTVPDMTFQISALDAFTAAI